MFTDIAGNLIEEGDIIKMFHFIGTRRKKHFIYKQVGEFNHDKKWFICFHLPIKEGSGRFILDKDICKISLVIQTNNINKNLKASKFTGF